MQHLHLPYSSSALLSTDPEELLERIVIHLHKMAQFFAISDHTGIASREYFRVTQWSLIGGGILWHPSVTRRQIMAGEATMNTQSDLFDSPHARISDPLTSHEAAASIDITTQAMRILRAYADGQALLDVEAYRRAGFPPHACDGQRCSDLRRLGLIARTGDRARTPSGKSGYLCRITEAGMKSLASS